jgi:ribosomal protein S27AE
MLSSKKCLKCKKTKDLSQFYWHSYWNKYVEQCKECLRKKYLNEWNKRYSDEDKKEIWRNASKNSRINHPEKWLARRELNKAIKTGLIIKGICEVCGETKVNGHHTDYSKPLVVRWLCSKCHRKLHIKLKNEK